MRVVPRSTTPRWLLPVLAVLAFLATLALTAGPIRLAGANPAAAFRFYLIRPLSSSYSLFEVLLAATPLVFTGVAALVAFRSGYWNIGAEGQFIAGAIGTTGTALALPDLPSVVAIPLALLAGSLAGALWGVVPALLRVHRGIDEVVTTLLLNPVGLLVLQGLLNGPWRNPKTGFTESADVPEAYVLPRMVASSRLHWGFVIAVVVALVVWATLRYTALGMASRAVGLSPRGARFSGIAVERTMISAALTSAAIAGLGGAVQVLGLQHRLTGEVSLGFGYTGIVVATLAALIVPLALAAATLIATVTVGAESAARALQLPPQMGKILTATLLLVSVAMAVFYRRRIVWRTGRRST